MEFKEILNRKIEHYGKTEAAYEFAAEEYSNRLIKEAQAEQLILHGVSQRSELLQGLFQFYKGKFGGGFNTDVLETVIKQYEETL